jgi:hypothetical protein
VTSERQLQGEIEQIGTILADSGHHDDWEVRLHSLEKLLQLTYGGANDFQCFIPAMVSIKEHLVKQVADLRSQIVREACHVLTSIAETVGDSFEPLAAPLLKPLLNVTFASIHIMASSGDNCIKGIIRATPTGFGQMIPLLLDGLKTRNKTLRTHCMMYLTIAFDSWSTTVLKKYTDAVAKTLQSSFSDAEGGVRKHSRECFWAFSRCFESKASQLMNKLDSNQQRHLHEEKARQESTDRMDPALSAPVLTVREQQQRAYQQQQQQIQAPPSPPSQQVYSTQTYHSHQSVSQQVDEVADDGRKSMLHATRRTLPGRSAARQEKVQQQKARRLSSHSLSTNPNTCANSHLYSTPNRTSKPLRQRQQPDQYEDEQSLQNQQQPPPPPQSHGYSRTPKTASSHTVTPKSAKPVGSARRVSLGGDALRMHQQQFLEQEEQGYGHGKSFPMAAAQRVATHQPFHTHRKMDSYLQPADDSCDDSGQYDQLEELEQQEQHEYLEQQEQQEQQEHSRGATRTRTPARRMTLSTKATSGNSAKCTTPGRKSMGGAVRVSAAVRVQQDEQMQQQMQQQAQWTDENTAPDNSSGYGDSAARRAPPSHPTRHPESVPVVSSGVGLDDNRTLKTVMQEASGKDSSWSNKVDAFERIGTFASMGRRRAEMRSAMPKLTRLLVSGIDDVHYKVTVAALGAVYHIVVSFTKKAEDGSSDSSAVTPNLEALLPSLFARLAPGSKTQVRNMANETLVTIQQKLPPPKVIAAIVKVAEKSSPKIKQSALECANELVIPASEFLRQAGPMRTLVLRASECILSGDPGAKGTGIMLLHSLYRLHADVLLTGIQSLDVSRRHVVRNALVPKIPTIVAELDSLPSRAGGVPKHLAKASRGNKSNRTVEAAAENSSHYQEHIPQHIPQHMPLTNGGNGIPYEFEAGMGLEQQYQAQPQQYAGEVRAGDAVTMYHPARREAPQQQADRRRRRRSSGAHEDEVAALEMPTTHARAITSKSFKPSRAPLTENGSQPYLHEQAYKPQQHTPKQSRPSTAPAKSPGSASQMGMVMQRMCSGNLETRKEGLEEIYRSSQKFTSEEWRAKSGQVIMMVMESMKVEGASLLAMQVMGQLLRTQPEGFHDYMEVVLTRLIDCYKSPDSSREVSHAAEKALEQLVKVIDPHRCMQVLQPVIMVETGQALQVQTVATS